MTQDERVLGTAARAITKVIGHLLLLPRRCLSLLPSLMLARIWPHAVDPRRRVIWAFGVRARQDLERASSGPP
jgi:hypothetical protein